MSTFSDVILGERLPMTLNCLEERKFRIHNFQKYCSGDGGDKGLSIWRSLYWTIRALEETIRLVLTITDSSH